MGTYTVYRLKFKTQLHLGRYIGPAQTGSLGLQKTETYIPADTLFSAICQMWATFYDTTDLTDFLNLYSPKNESLPFTLTSAFPFAKDIYLFPKPMSWTDRSKESKSIQFVSNNIFRQLINGNRPRFSKEELMTGEKVWITDDEKNQLKTSDEDDDYSVWTTNTRPRVTIGSRNAGSEIWHVQTVQFNKCCGLWFAADFNEDDAMKQKFETLLRVLGDCGIGGERNAGYGLFEFDNDATIELPEAVADEPFVTLSPICPQSAAQLQQMLSNDNISYTLKPSTGWISSPGSGDRRKRINLFTEGSVLNTPKERVGRLVDLRPENYTHPVYRYGYAWQVGIKGTGNETEIQT